RRVPDQPDAVEGGLLGRLEPGAPDGGRQTAVERPAPQDPPAGSARPVAPAARTLPGRPAAPPPVEAHASTGGPRDPRAPAPGSMGQGRALPAHCCVSLSRGARVGYNPGDSSGSWAWGSMFGGAPMFGWFRKRPEPVASQPPGEVFPWPKGWKLTALDEA